MGSCVGVSRVHVWSLAVFHLPHRLRARGQRAASPVVLPGAALGHTGVREVLEDPSLTKAVHNLPVDAHSLRNHGVALRGAVNTLSLARWLWPERVQSAGGRGFGLKALMEDLLDIPVIDTYKSVVGDKRVEYRTTSKKVRRCECGTVPCRRRGAGHVRHDATEDTVHERLVDFEIPLTDIVPGHPRWERLLPYAATDAVAALELYDLAMQEDMSLWGGRVLPW